MTIMQNDNMVSINTILEMDLTGQVCSESIGPPSALRLGRRLLLRLWRPALQGRPGHPGLRLPQQEGPAQDQAHADPRRRGHHPRNYVDYIVTEYGVARMQGPQRQ